MDSEDDEDEEPGFKKTVPAKTQPVVAAKP